MKNKTVEERMELANQFKAEALLEIFSHKKTYDNGFRAKQEGVDKTLLDTLNKYKSNLANEQRVKLTKTVNEEKVKLLEGQIQVLLEIQNKLK